MSGLPAYRSVAGVTTLTQWLFVRQRFRCFLDNISLTTAQITDGWTKIRGVVFCLNRNYWNISSETQNYVLVGSWGKQTTVRPPRDIDLMFFLPPSVYYRYAARSGNRQSQLLQEVKSVLLPTFSRTDLKGDGQVIVAPFDTFKVEVVPAFVLESGQALICDANEGGKYKTVDPVAEFNTLDWNDRCSSSNVRDLVRMLKQWQRTKNVPIKSFVIERLAIEFVYQWPHKGYDEFWYDWMVRDFFLYALGRAGSWALMPGTGELVSLGNAWLSSAENAYRRACEACYLERINLNQMAGDKWQEIFGFEIPRNA